MKIKFWGRKKRNTKRRGILHFVIFKWNGRYLGICKETGSVEEAKTFEETKKKVINGSIAILKAVITSKQNLEASLNTSPPFKYAIYYRIAFILGFLEHTRDLFIKDSCKETNFSCFTRSIPSLKCNG